MTKIEISLKTLLIVAALIILYKFLIRIEYILILVLFAYIITAAINPLITFLQTKGVKRWLSISAIYILLFLAIVSLFLFIVVPLIKELIELLRQLPTLLDKLLRSWPFIQSTLGIDRMTLSKNITQLSKTATRSLLDANTGFITVYHTAIGIVQVLATILSVIVMSIYMLLEQESHHEFLSNLIPQAYRKRVFSIQEKVEAKLGQWAQAQFILCFVVFVLNYLVLTLFHVEFALTIALIAGFLEVVPIAGPIIAALLVFLFALLLDPTYSIYILIASILIHQLENHLLVPKIMQKVIGLSPLVTIIALLIGAEFVGLVGIVLSVPIAATLQIFYLELQKND